MDCVSTVQKALRLRPRRLKGLRRPTQEVRGLGTAELVREERCHGWQVQRQLVPTRATVVGEVVFDDESPSDAKEYWDPLWSTERATRLSIAKSQWELRHQDVQPMISCEDIEKHVDSWIAPYRIGRSGDGYLVQYDCTDAPGASLMGIVLMNAFVERDGKVTRLDVLSESLAPEWELRDAYLRRVVPDECGFVADSIADRLICAGFVGLSDEYWTLLNDSIQQTEALVRNANENSKDFLSAALRMLQLVHKDATERAKR